MTAHQIMDRQQLDAAAKLNAGVPLSIRDFCALEGCSREGWYQHVRRGTAPAFYRNGSLVRIDPADYRAWQRAGKAETAAAGLHVEAA